MNTVEPQVQAPENLALVLNSGSSSIKFQLVDPMSHLRLVWWSKLARNRAQ